MHTYVPVPIQTFHSTSEFSWKLVLASYHYAPCHLYNFHFPVIDNTSLAAVTTSEVGATLASFNAEPLNFVW